MLSLSGLAKPQYFFRPSQILRRLLRETHPKKGLVTVTLPWKTTIEVNTNDTHGEGVANQGIYDLVTTEVIWRLTEPGDAAIDVGANVGYFTSLLAARVGNAGSVMAFEPHPITASLLRKNVERFRNGRRLASIVVHQVALSNSDGEAMLDVFPKEENNTSWAYLNPKASYKGIPVKTARLERFLDRSQPVGILKVDAQWHEKAVFQGMGDYLKSAHVRDIIFEEEALFPAPSHKVLTEAGYHLFWFEETFWGLRLIPPDAKPRKMRSYDTLPSYLATANPERAKRLFSPRGWRCF
jgi:FkbM family methyltransferase